MHTSITLRKQLTCDKWGQSGDLLQSYPIAIKQITKVDRMVVTEKYVNMSVHDHDQEFLSDAVLLLFSSLSVLFNGIYFKRNNMIAPYCFWLSAK